MSIAITVEPIDRDIAVILQDNLSPKAQSAALAAAARDALADAKEENEEVLGAVPPYDTFVDGTQGKNEDQVSPDGEIVYQFKLIGDALTYIDEQLIAHSPVKSGRYQRSHMLYADGSEADPNTPPLGATEYVFLNVQPYARKIERGESPSAPEGVYEGIALQASSLYGDTAAISFAYRSAPSGAVGAWAKTPGAKRLARHAGRRKGAAAWLTQQPAIVIRPA